MSHSRVALLRSRRRLFVSGVVALAAVGVSVSLASGPVTVAVRAEATLEPGRSVTVGRDATGGLRNVRVDVGQAVSAGQPVARADETQARAAYLQAVGAVVTARESLRKLTAPPSPSSRADARAALRQARLTLEQAEARFAEARAKAALEAAAPPAAANAEASRTLASAEARLAAARARGAFDARRLTGATRRAEHHLAAARTRLTLARTAREEALARAAAAAVAFESALEAQVGHQDEQLSGQADLGRRQEAFEIDSEKAQRASADEQSACIDDPSTPGTDPPTAACVAARSARSSADAALADDRSGMSSVRARLAELTGLLATDARWVASATSAKGEADAALARADGDIVQRRAEVPGAAEALRTTERDGEAARLDREVSLGDARTAVADARAALQAQARVGRSEAETSRLARRSVVREASDAVASARLALRTQEEGRAARAVLPPESEIEAARFQVASAVAARKTASEALRATTLRAPFDGVVTAAAATGEGQGITIVTRTSFVASGTVGAVDATRVRAGQRATVSVGGTSFDGRVASVALTPVEGQREPRYVVRVAFSSAATWLLPGLAAEIQLRLTIG